MSNRNLNNAIKLKQDEFYTKLSDIEKELKHYKSHFKNKVVFCNCDDPFESNFFKYFANNFNFLKLKRLIATCYDGSKIANKQLRNKCKRTPYKIIINQVKDYNNDGTTDLLDVEYLIKNTKNVLTELNGNGDFRSKECIELLKQSDIVVTNPPFSLFKEYVAQLVEYNKKFIIIGNKNALKYKEIFPLIKTEKIWLGFTSASEFFTPDGSITKKVQGLTRWFSNLDIPKRHESVVDMLYKKYSPSEYPKYDNYDAIDVSVTNEIPYNYKGIMGVPITYLDRHNPDEFEIVGVANHGSDSKYDLFKPTIKGKELYARVLIKRKQ